MLVLWAVRSANLLRAADRPVGVVPLIPMTSFANTINNLTPGSMGELIRLYLLRAHHGVEYPVGAAVVLIERVVAFGYLTGSALILYLAQAVAVPWPVAVGALVVLAALPPVAYRAGLRPMSIVAAVPFGRLLGTERWARVGSALRRVDVTIARLLTDPRRAAFFAVTSALVYVAYTTQLLLVAAAFGQRLDPFVAWGARSGHHGRSRLAPAVRPGLHRSRRRRAAHGRGRRPGPGHGDRGRLSPRGDAPAGARRHRLVRAPVGIPAGLRGERRDRRGEPRPQRHGRVGMTPLAGLCLIAAFVAASALVLPAIGRTGLGIWHPAVAWLALEAVFFGVGGVVLALQGTPGPALFTTGAIVVFGLAVAVSDRLARARSSPSIPDTQEGGSLSATAAPIRLIVAVALVGAGLLAILGTVVGSGLPFLAGDITGARSELTGSPSRSCASACPRVWSPSRSGPSSARRMDAPGSRRPSRSA